MAITSWLLRRMEMLAQGWCLCANTALRKSTKELGRRRAISWRVNSKSNLKESCQARNTPGSLPTYLKRKKTANSLLKRRWKLVATSMAFQWLCSQLKTKWCTLTCWLLPLIRLIITNARCTFSRMTTIWQLSSIRSNQIWKNSTKRKVKRLRGSSLKMLNGISILRAKVLKRILKF